MKYANPKDSRSHRSRFFTSRITFIALAAFALLTLAATSAFMAPLPGAIFTTDSACTGTDLNIYAAKTDVYIDGGPAHPGAAGLPDGFYYVQVTAPGGGQLGTSVGSGNDTPVHVTNGEFDQCYQLSAILIKTSDGTPGYDDTTNPGGEYKVWVSTVSTFDNDSTKTDNFKVKEAAPPSDSILRVIKFYDADGTGTQTAGDTEITGWEVHVGAQATFDTIFETKTTPVSIFVDPGCYTAQEGDATNWIHTNASIQSVIVPQDGTGTISFGNVCLGPGGGLTLGFWSNKNGQATMNDGGTLCPELTLLNNLCLRNATGADADFACNYTTFRSWLLNATATNMAYMLSAQLAAMELNVEAGFVSPSSLVYAPGTNITANDIVTIQQLMNAAAASLCAHGYTPSGSPDRAYQEALKTALDKANNNLNFVQSAAQCGVANDGTISGISFTYSAATTPDCP